MQSAWADQPGWQQFTVGWYLVWPAWLAAWLMLAIVGADSWITPAAMAGAWMVVQYVRLLLLHRKQFELFHVRLIRKSHLDGPLGPFEAIQVLGLMLFFQALPPLTIYAISLFVKTKLLPAPSPSLMWSPVLCAAALRRSFPNFRFDLTPGRRK